MAAGSAGGEEPLHRARAPPAVDLDLRGDRQRRRARAELPRLRGPAPRLARSAARRGDERGGRPVREARRGDLRAPQDQLVRARRRRVLRHALSARRFPLPRQADRDARAVLVGLGAALDLDAPAVRGDDVAHQREREPVRVRRARPSLEQVGQLLPRDPGAVVLDRNRDVSGGLLAVDVHEDAPAGALGVAPPHVAERVAHERRDRPGELLRIDGERRDGAHRLHAQLDLALPGLLDERREARTQEFGDVGALAPHQDGLRRMLRHGGSFLCLGVARSARRRPR